MLLLGKKLAIQNGGARKTKLRVAVHKIQDQHILKTEEHHCDVGAWVLIYASPKMLLKYYAVF